jgi:hypothetical protein
MGRAQLNRRFGKRTVTLSSVSSNTNKTEVDAPDKALTRRRIFMTAIGAAAVGGTGGALLAGNASPAQAATSVASGGTAPNVVALTDAATIAVDASLGNDFRVTIAASRTMANPSNPTDGQQIVFQITQGTGGSSTITWGSDYEFSTGLPQPTLSTTTGMTDVLGFIYNATLGSWLFSLFLKGFPPASTSTTSPSPSATATPTPSPTPTLQPGAYRFFPATNGPSAAVSYSGPFIAGLGFEVTAYSWMTGFWWWVCDTGQSTAAQEFTLYQLTGEFSGVVVPNTTVTSGALTAGQWNYVALPEPVALSQHTPYVLATGFSGGFPITNNQFGAGEPFASGITSGPLSAYSDRSGSNPAPMSYAQGTFATAGTDPTGHMPDDGSGSSNFWIDVQVTTVPPNGSSQSYRIWPSQPAPYPQQAAAIDTGEQTSATEFLLSQPCILDKIWFYSPPGVGVLPSRCAIWNVATQTVVAGTDNTAPAWSGAVASGWVYVDYSGSGVTLPAGDYKVSIFNSGGQTFYTETVDYFSSGPGGNGLVSGPITVPNTANATPPGNSTYQDGSWAYPMTFDDTDKGENRWIDVEVTPVSS